MQVMMNLVLLLQLVTAIAMIGLVLMQHGKGADMGAAFGGGSSGSLFGATGSANFLSRSTAVAATLFFVCTLALAYFGNLRGAGGSDGSILDRASAPAPVAASGPVAAQIPGLVAAPAASAAAASAPASR
ncbi:preprotein translocase subunit SecG [Sphaerotilus montanus]|jgi:preprotein translocase subunit SecG|uniref:Protein-export membrane protein SecG n=1 Tax=Sphaerotilus montanus TaxID=522889 RepID=A0A7Y9U6M5_9BURK|nr:preprotein translocase subunit SecG [Sphaerotilus montanus]NYG34183.1 preprotein translocase subunit SecG [Sphaerotilus montanus]NZD55833.1 preprotein translocase subunit SecG [Sphaerotilus montanus]